MSEFEKFKSDFETHKLFVPAIKSGVICFSSHNSDYNIYDFWRFVKDYQLEKIEDMESNREKLMYLKKIIPQINIIKQQYYESFMGFPVSEELCRSVIEQANRIVEILNHHISDIERFIIDQINTKPISREKHKTQYQTFDDAVKDRETLNTIIKVLSNKRVIDNQGSVITRRTTLLYSFIKYFINHGYFKKITNEQLHPLVNVQFKTNKSYQLFKQTDAYNKTLD